MIWKVFYSYSHKDRDLRDRLGVFLTPLKRQQKISEWWDQQIGPGDVCDKEISSQLDEANLILLLVSPDFLASEYCFGVEIERAMARLKRCELKVIPILLKACLWKDSPFSELQLIPRDGKPVTAWPDIDVGMTIIAEEIRKVVSESPPSSRSGSESGGSHLIEASLDLVRAQIHAYAQLYERTRQRTQPSDARTERMQQIFAKMRELAAASYPLLGELAASPLPGERLAAVAILQVFSSERFFEFLVKIVGSERPFVGYQAVCALRFAVGAIDVRLYGSLAKALTSAEDSLNLASVGFDADRQTMIRQARDELRSNIQALTTSSAA
jgi:TIR domain